MKEPFIDDQRMKTRSNSISRERSHRIAIPRSNSTSQPDSPIPTSSTEDMQYVPPRTGSPRRRLGTLWGGAKPKSERELRVPIADDGNPKDPPVPVGRVLAPPQLEPVVEPGSVGMSLQDGEASSLLDSPHFVPLNTGNNKKPSAPVRIGPANKNSAMAAFASTPKHRKSVPASSSHGHHHHHHPHSHSKNQGHPDWTSIDSTSSGTSHSSGKMRHNRKRLKELGYGADGVWPTGKHLRRIFRLFDEEGKGSLTPAQFKAGLEALDFDVSNTHALGNLVREMDKEHVGLITEQAFMTGFSNLNREMLETKLATEAEAAQQGEEIESDAPIVLTVFDLGKDKKHGMFESRNVKSVEISSVLSQRPRWKNHIRWIDIKGYSESWLELAATVLNLPAPVLEDMEFEQRAKVEYYSNHGTEVMQIVSHAVTLENFPVRKSFRRRGGGSWLKSKEDGYTEVYHKLVRSKEYRMSKPKLLLSQIHLFIIEDHTLLTYRKHHSNPAMDDIWADIIPQIEHHVCTLKGPFLLTAMSLATELLDEIAEHNWLSRDQFKEWKTTLEDAIRENSNSSHLSHILDMQQCALVASNVFKPCAEMMEWLTDESRADTPKALFIKNYIDDFRDVFESFTRLYDQAQFTAQSCAQLQLFYKNAQDDKMNRTLYLLALVTTAMAPPQLMAGIYGMNFDEMPDLHWPYSYTMFWVGLICFFILVTLWFKMKKLI